MPIGWRLASREKLKNYGASSWSYSARMDSLNLHLFTRVWRNGNCCMALFLLLGTHSLPLFWRADPRRLSYAYNIPSSIASHTKRLADCSKPFCTLKSYVILGDTSNAAFCTGIEKARIYGVSRHPSKRTTPTGKGFGMDAYFFLG